MLVLPVLAELLFLLEALVPPLLFVRFVLVLQQVSLPSAVLLILSSLAELLSIWNVLGVVLGSLGYMLLTKQRVIKATLDSLFHRAEPVLGFFVLVCVLVGKSSWKELGV